MIDLHTSASLLSKLSESAAREMTENELRSQRISYVMGTLKEDSSVTREQVKEILARHEGKKTAA